MLGQNDCQTAIMTIVPPGFKGRGLIISRHHSSEKKNENGRLQNSNLEYESEKSKAVYIKIKIVVTM